MSSDAYLGVRKDYDQRTLDREDLRADPIEQLRLWLAEAHDAGLIEPNAVCLSTSTPAGQPSARMLLLRSLDERGLTVFTNYESRKAKELEANSYAAMTFWWGGLERQVRIEGLMERVPSSESDAYFASRPYESQIASAASPQSRPIASREDLEAAMDALRSAHPTVVPRPKTWGGYRLVPASFEFWQGRAARTHDRFLYTRSESGWAVVRLAP